MGTESNQEGERVNRISNALWKAEVAVPLWEGARIRSGPVKMFDGSWCLHWGSGKGGSG